MGKGKKILSMVLLFAMVTSTMELRTFAAEQEGNMLSPKEQVRQCDIIGTAYVDESVEDEAILEPTACVAGEEAAIMPFSAEGSYATISKVRVVKYANYYTNIFRVQTETGSWTGYCAEPRRKAMPGVYAVSVLHNDTIKKLLLSGPEGPYYDQVKDGLFAGLTWDTAFADTHAAIGYVYSGDTTGMDAWYLDGILNQIECVTNGWVGDILDDVVDRYTAYIAYNAAGQDIVWLEYRPKGFLKLQKVSSNPDITRGNSCYSLAGAVYGVYTDWSCREQVGTLTTTESGSSNSLELFEGTYYVKEISPSRGYLLDDKIHSVAVTGENTSMLNVTEEPGSDPTVIRLQKVDQDTGKAAQGGASLAGAQFTVRYYDEYYTEDTLPSSYIRRWVIEVKEVVKDQATGETIYYTELSDEYKVEGNEFFRDSVGTIVLPLGTIAIEETRAPEGYQRSGACFQVEGADGKQEGLYVSQITEEGGTVRLKGQNSFTVSNSVIRGGVRIWKKDYDTGKTVPQGDATFAGTGIEILNDNDVQVTVDGVVYGPGEVVCRGVTGQDGTFATSGDLLPYGAYRFRETEAPKGYLLEGVLEGTFRIERNGVIVSGTIPNTVLKDRVIKCPIVITKVSNDGSDSKPPLSGAGFCLYPASSECRDNDRIVLTEDGGKVIYTDENGYAETVPIPYGTYILRERYVPVGHQKMEDIVVQITGEEVQIDLTVENERKTGTVTVIKKDDRGYPVEDIEFTLYDQADHAVAVQRTDQYGMLRMEGLEWGAYYLRETDAPDYYIMDQEKHEIILSATSLSKTFEIVNETVKGTVILTKTDESGTAALSGAEYTLYTSDGARVGTYVTDETGRICVEGLAWGSYYFKEIKAPVGYGLSDETVRFSVNSMNADVIQRISVIDPPEMRALTLTKRIAAADINFANGTPSFIFCVSGTDMNGTAHEYYRVVTFDAAYVSANTGSDGYVSQSVVFPEMMAGIYEAGEVDVGRYALENISDVSENGRICRTESTWSVTFNLVDFDDGHATFTNRKYEHRNYSDSQCLVNVLKQRARLTALKVKYGKTAVEVGSVVETSILTVTAIYDDGTIREVDQNGYSLSITEFPNVVGDYTVEVTYTEGGITRTGNFTVTVYSRPRLEDAQTFNRHIKRLYNSATAIVFTDEKAPANVSPVDVSAAKNRSVVAWSSGNTISSSNTTVYISTQVKGEKVVANGFREGYTGELAMFEGFGNLVRIDAENLDVGEMKSMTRMFANCSKLTSLKIGSWDVSGVLSMNSMFLNCSRLMSLDIENWDVSNVNNMGGMFNGCKMLILDCSAWNVSKVTSYANFNYNAARVIAPAWTN